ncbi:MAG: type I methionyl aminopeptidase [Gemmatimonadetes bacterium]|nr:type I methionyl aminopeptidase [Gemmatimonadota bacterium]
MIHLRSAEEIEAIGQAGAIVGGLFEAMRDEVLPGASTLKLDRFCEEYIVSHEGAVPAFKGLYGFPGSACISINEEVVHGIPSHRRVLKDGDIVSVDLGVRLDGWYTDSARTFPVGEVSREAKTLVDVTRKALRAAVSAATPGNHVGDIGAAVVEALGGRPYGIIRDLVGHGIGRDLHEEPQVPNVGRPGHGPLLREGMVLAIEPMISAGTASIRTLDDGWTVVTADGSLAAHFEHTVAVTANGPRVLTAATGGEKD